MSSGRDTDTESIHFTRHLCAAAITEIAAVGAPPGRPADLPALPFPVWPEVLPPLSPAPEAASR